MQITHAPRDTRHFGNGRLGCAQCGEHLYIAEWSEYMDRDRVRHLWACDSCGYAFETIVRFSVEVDRAAA
jgi:hypothetical protein